jgi:hypothetical protein
MLTGIDAAKRKGYLSPAGMDLRSNRHISILRRREAVQNQAEWAPAKI